METNKNIYLLNDLFKSVQPELNTFFCDVNTVCRVCLEKSQKMCNIFEPKVGHISNEVPNMIMACASVQIMNGDGLPNTICSRCLTRLKEAWQFKVLCETSDAKLRQFYFNNAQPLEIAQALDSLSYVKQEQSLQYLKESSHVDEAAFSNESGNVLQFSEMPPQQSNVEDEKGENSDGCKKTKSRSAKKDHKSHQCDTCGKVFSRKEYLTQHIRIHTGEKPYRCHLCEKRFVNSGHLTTHMRTHTGERPHACTLCPKAFSTRQELHKHTMVHNGERPFVCKLCGKSFGSSSNLYSHLKHHTGEKNFTCEHCGKAFYTKQELKQHLVVHTGEKAFLCEFCNKRFSQIAHLRRHSKLHK